jgi:hypothetical protein
MTSALRDGLTTIVLELNLFTIKLAISSDQNKVIDDFVKFLYIILLVSFKLYKGINVNLSLYTATVFQESSLRLIAVPKQ